MTFDKARVCTELEADKTETGARGFFANSFLELKRLVEAGGAPDKLAAVEDAGTVYRFCSDAGRRYELFYPAEHSRKEKAGND